MAGPLTGIRVVDFSRVLAGPHCAQTLLDLGAEVIKIEPPTRRPVAPGVPSRGRDLRLLRATERRQAQRLHRPQRGGRGEVALRLCDRADVIVESFRPGTLAGVRAGLRRRRRAQPGRRLRLDQRLRPARAVARALGLRADRAGRGGDHRDQPPAHSGTSAHRLALARRCLLRAACRDRDPRRAG